MSEKENRIARILIRSLGGLWVLDGILQLQPAMFTSSFVSTVLAPNLQSEPHVIESVVAFGIAVFSKNIFWFNLASALIQLLIGVLLIFPVRGKFLRYGLWLSAGWALIVWIFGEGFGMLATGSATFFTGAPGSAFLYLFLSLIILYSAQKPSLIKKLPMIAGVMFVACAALNATPMFWQPTMLSMTASVSAVSGWLGAFGAQGTITGNFLLIDLLVCLGILLIFLPHRPTAWTVIGFLILVWWIGQNFGGIQTFPFGTATDPDSAPLFILFLLPALF